MKKPKNARTNNKNVLLKGKVVKMQGKKEEKKDNLKNGKQERERKRMVGKTETGNRNVCGPPEVPGNSSEAQLPPLLLPALASSPGIQNSHAVCMKRKSEPLKRRHLE